MTVIVLIGCSKNASKIKYNNDIFTQDIYNNISEIVYADGDKTHVITDKETITNIYSELASLEFSPYNDNIQKYGHMLINIKTNVQTIEIGLLSEEISIGSKKYYIDKDICSYLRKLIIK
jgi:hypothetical protein